MKGGRVAGSSKWLKSWQWNVVVFSTLFKLLLVPAYHSTDFEVHRHWLALTNSLPVSQWYFDETSKWTLDYPPFFAFFSWLLSIPAKHWDPRIVNLIEGLEYDGWKCVLYMRFTVIFTELTLAGALFALSNQSTKSRISNIPAVVAASLLLHPGLIIVDHIHFQYNGFLIGILLWSVWAARQGRALLCAFLFSSLLNFKHIFIYIAPAYFIYLLQSYVVHGGGSQSVSHSGVSERLFTLGVITLIPFALSIIPLALTGFSTSAPAGPIGILSQMLSRLFPFSRGLTHAYWAANVWALYTFADRALIKLLPSSFEDISGSTTRGIIGDTRFTVLPQIGAGHCFLLTLVFTALFSVRLFIKPTQTAFVQAITLFGLTSFLFGFHVHEKAILLPLIPLTLLAHVDYFYVRMTLLLSAPGVVALFPLLYQDHGRETPIKFVYSALWFLIAFRAMFAFHFRPTPSNWELLLHHGENMYLVGLLPLQLFASIVHPVWTAGGLGASMTAGTKAATSNMASLAANSSLAAAQIWTSEAQQATNTTLAETLSSAAGVAMDAVQEQVSPAMAAIVDLAKNTTNHSPAVLQTLFGSSPSLVSTDADNSISASMEFLPLMMTSVYCAFGVVFVWLRLGYRFLTHDEEAVKEQAHIRVTASSPQKAQ